MAKKQKRKVKNIVLWIFVAIAFLAGAGTFLFGCGVIAVGNILQVQVANSMFLITICMLLLGTFLLNNRDKQ